MEMLFNDGIVEVHYDKEKSFLEYIWFPESENIYYSRLLTSLDKVEEYIKILKPNLLFNNSISFRGIVPVEGQRPMAEGFLNIMEEGCVKKMAISMPTEMFTLLSAEQTLDESRHFIHDRPFQIVTFKTNEKAKEWLFTSLN